MSSLLSTINQTPGLLEKFKNICAGATGWADLSAAEKSLFENYKQALTA
jgi:hypothetical protein